MDLFTSNFDPQNILVSVRQTLLAAYPVFADWSNFQLSVRYESMC
jgi:hypothetical protein